jgi:hypothetical protein
MPKGIKPPPPQQSNLNEFWGKPRPKKKVEETPVASGSRQKKEDTVDMQVDEPSHQDPKGTRPFSSQPVIVVELHPAEVASSPPYGMS